MLFKFSIIILNVGGSVLNKVKYVVDIGSSKLKLLAISSNKCSRIFAEETILYDGFMDGEFLSPEKLEDDFTKLINQMQLKTRKQVSAVTVGITNDFCVCVCKRIARKYADLHKITENDILELYRNNQSFGDSDEYTLINYSPLQYVLDNGITTLNPVGQKTMSLTLDASFILAKTEFINLIIEKFANIGIDKVDFISTSLGQALNCPIQRKQNQIAIIDVGHITTNVSVLKGEGLALMSSFSMGGGHISSDIMQLLSLNFKNAELIKRKVLITVESNKNDFYQVCNKGNLIKSPINITNQIVKSRIEMICKVIKNILSVNEVFEGIDIYLTGDGIANFRGAKNIMEEILNSRVYLYKNEFDNTNEKFQTSKIGLLKLIDISK